MGDCKIGVALKEKKQPSRRNAREGTPPWMPIHCHPLQSSTFLVEKNKLKKNKRKSEKTNPRTVQHKKKEDFMSPCLLHL